MDQALLEILVNDIRIIKWLAVAMLVIFIICLISIILIAALIKKNTEDHFFNGYRDKASDLLDRNDIEGVIKLSEEKLKEYPYDLYAHWYLAQAYYRKKEWHKALEEFNLISDISPSWREDYIDPYVYEVKEKLKNSKPEIVKK